MEELIYSIDWEQVKNSFDIFMWGDPNIPVHKGMAWVEIAVAAIGAIISGAQAISAKKRRKKALEEYKINKAAFEAQEITNPYENLENPYEDLTVNQKQARFLAQQQQLGLATTMRAMGGAAGGSGIASLAQSVANAQTRNLQGISGSIGQQETRNQALAAQGQLRVDALRGQGEQARQIREVQKQGTLLGMSQMDVAGEQQRLDAAMGGVATNVGMLGGAIQDQMELGGIKQERDRLTQGNNLSGQPTKMGNIGTTFSTSGRDMGGDVRMAGYNAGRTYNLGEPGATYNPLSFANSGGMGYGYNQMGSVSGNAWGNLTDVNSMDFWRNRDRNLVGQNRYPGYYTPFFRRN